ncbi:MAG: LuxR C-terminal-related transcriptional regulator, partial [Solirubrobacteraceae bacterium]
ILTTSREALAIAGERVWQVPALAAPGDEEPPIPERLMAFDAVSLFVERASAAQPTFALSEDSAGAVAEITRRLDGIPLAIELAAARMQVLTAAEIARRLDDRFALLVKGDRSQLSRHRTLQAAVDWSHELLSAPERVLLRRLSVFVGGFSLEAVEAVCGPEELEGLSLVELLAGLVAKSLVIADTTNGTGRYHLLETIRAYADDRLGEAGEALEAGAAHARYFLSLAERAEPELTGPTQQHWFERLEGERENLIRAIEWSLAHDRPQWALRLTGALAIFWRVRSHFSEGRELAQRALAAGDGGRSAVEAKALWAAGFMALMTDDAAAAIAPLEESLSCFEELGDLQGKARALLMLTNSKLFLGDPNWPGALERTAAWAREAEDSWCLSLALFVAGFAYATINDLPEARPLLEESLAVAREAQEKQGMHAALLGLGKVEVRQGDYRAAEGLLHEAVSIAGDLDDDYSRAAAHEFLAELAVGRGDYRRARESLDEFFAIADAGQVGELFGPLVLLATVARADGDRAGAAERFAEAARESGALLSRALQGMGELAAEEGDADRARRLFEEALELARARAQNNRSAAAALHGLGDLARDAGDVQRAAALHHEALNLRRHIGALPDIAASLEAIGGVAAVAGRHVHAARLLGAAEAQRERGGYARAPWESARYKLDLELIGQALAREELDAAFDQGQGLSTEEAMAQASKGRGRRTRPASGWSSLTEAERQVAMLVAEGLTNPEIAERLLVSLAAIKAHVSSIFPKLGVSGRREIARQVQRRRQHPM